MKTKALLIIILIANISFGQIDFGLVSSWSFNSANANDETGTNHGTVTGATLTNDRFGLPNQAYYFDGIDDKISFGDPSDFQFGYSDFSYSLWFKIDIAQFAVIFGKLNVFNGYALSVGDSTGTTIDADTYVRSSATESGTGRIISKKINDINWHHAVVIHKYNCCNYLYVDNQLVNVDSTVFAYTDGFDISGRELLLGTETTFNTHFQGGVDDIRIYNRVISLEDIDTLYNMPAITLKDEIDLSKNISIYPNPTNGKINVLSEDIIQIEIINTEGKTIMVFNENNLNSDIDISGFDKGIYIIRVISNKGVAVERIVLE